MKSLIIENSEYIENKENYSELKVLHSGAGYYIGTIYNNPDGYKEPGSRDSNYFKSNREAEEFLKELENGSIHALNKLRTHP